MKQAASALQKVLQQKADRKKAAFYQSFFKTGKGQYAEGDVFLGLSVPETRIIAKKFSGLELKEIAKLLRSKFHEVRLAGLVVLVDQYNRADEKEKKTIYSFYLKNSKRINNWDLVDSSAHHIVGEFLFDRSRKPVYDLVRSKNLWERRIAMIAAFYWIRKNDFADACKIAELLLNDEHDLIHKASGWMLREVGKRHQPTLERFLKRHHQKMPRTMLRYAIEKFPEKKRRRFMV